VYFVRCAIVRDGDARFVCASKALAMRQVAAGLRQVQLVPGFGFEALL